MLKRLSNKVIVLGVVIICIIGIYLFISSKNSGTDIDQYSDSSENAQDLFNKDKYSLTDPASQWVIINKQNAIPTDYEPVLVVPNVRLRLSASEQQMHMSKQAQSALEQMFTSAQKDNVDLVFGSGYRSAALQKQFYDSYVTQDGQQAADTYSARPGHSEHQTGLAVDITSPNGSCHLEICWENEPEGKWVSKNAHKFGFIIRYPKSKEAITGYQYEPWHLRYLGKDLATQIHQSGKTLEEFFDYPAAQNYN